MTEEYERYKRMQASRWMEHVRSLGRRVRSIAEEIEAQRELASGVQAVRYDGAPSGGAASGDAIPNAVARLQELIAEYVAEQAGYVEEQREAHEALRLIEDDACRDALTKHYLLGCNWERVCVDMGYTWDGMMALRRRALLAAYDRMPARWRDPMHPAI